MERVVMRQERADFYVVHGEQFEQLPLGRLAVKLLPSREVAITHEPATVGVYCPDPDV
jgi:hypothetical protein